LKWIEEDAAGFVRQLESGEKTSTAVIRRWEKRARLVCHKIFAEPAPSSLDQLVDTWRVWRPLVGDIKPGRPSSRDLVRAEAQRRLNAGEVPTTLSLKEFGTALSQWLATTHSGAPSMSGERVEKCVRGLWHASGRGRMRLRTDETPFVR
jgi:hypothetical protein